MSAEPSPPSGADPLPDRLRALLAAAVALTAPHDVDDVLQHIVEGAATVANARYAALGTYADDGAITRFVHHGVDDDTVARMGRLPEGRGLLGEIIIAEGPIRLADLTSDPRAAGFPEGHPAMHSFLGVPIVRHGRRYGNLYLTERRDGATFDDDDEAVVVMLAAFAAGAIESAELVEAERERAAAIAGLVAAEEQARARRTLLAGTIAAQEAERARVARDLHDDVGQALTSVLLGLRLMEASFETSPLDIADVRQRSADLRVLVADALERARRLAFDLRPTVLDDVGLVPALERLTTTVADRAGFDVELAVGIPSDERLSAEAETVVYRVVQEALTNVVRHAQASTVSVALLPLGEHVRVLVEDDGVGLDGRPLRSDSHLGIDGMKERAQLIGGTVTVTSEPGSGTTVMLDFPGG